MHKCSSYGLELNLWPFYHLTFKCDLDFQPSWINTSNEQLCQIILKSKNKCRSYNPDKLNLWLFYNLTFKCHCVTLTFNVPEQLFQIALLLTKENNCAKLFWNSCKNVEVMARTDPDGWMHTCTKHTQHTPIHQTEIVTTMSRSSQTGSTKMTLQ